MSEVLKPNPKNSESPDFLQQVKKAQTEVQSKAYWSSSASVSSERDNALLAGLRLGLEIAMGIAKLPIEIKLETTESVILGNTENPDISIQKYGFQDPLTAIYRSAYIESGIDLPKDL